MGLRRLIRLVPLLVLLAGCPESGQPAPFVLETSGHLEDKRIKEASGLARSQREPGILWVINDNGAKELVHAIAHDGSRLGEFDLKKSKNRDWEDLASVMLDDEPLLMIADIGDNDAKREKRTLYFVVEPEPEKKGKAKVEWKVEYVYPDGPRDAESAAVDIAANRALVLSKRDLPPQLYAIPLRADDDEIVEATLLGPVTSLYKPTQQQVAVAPKAKSWFWQPVGMDISEDGLAAVILTYEAVYYYTRTAEHDWYDAFNSAPARLTIGDFENAEAIAFANDRRLVVVTGENKHSPIISFDFEEIDRP